MLDILENDLNIELVKEEITKKLGSEVELKIYGMRNRVESFTGHITKIYPKLFMVENNYEQKSISYADVITKDVVVKYL